MKCSMPEPSNFDDEIVNLWPRRQLFLVSRDLLLECISSQLGVANKSRHLTPRKEPKLIYTGLFN